MILLKRGAIPACIAGGIPACLAAGLLVGLLGGAWSQRGSAPGVAWSCGGGGLLLWPTVVVLWYGLRGGGAEIEMINFCSNETQ